jgi:hypothetical protein
MNAWSHLPNAAHIDRVVASVNSHPEVWNQVWSQSLSKAWARAAERVRYQACEQARDQASHQVWYDACDQVSNQVSNQAWDQARDVLLALITYDDSAKYLKLSIDQLQMLYHLTEHPACLLLQPAAMVFAMERELA